MLLSSWQHKDSKALEMTPRQTCDNQNIIKARQQAEQI
uniref:Uncharacterized protein n=1 Tax=Rhizophora mucronata TaxID=61149 RepID=A0A2P2P355_RHIMU